MTRTKNCSPSSLPWRSTWPPYLVPLSACHVCWGGEKLGSQSLVFWVSVITKIVMKTFVSSGRVKQSNPNVVLLNAYTEQRPLWVEF